MTTLEKIHDVLYGMNVDVIDCRLKANKAISVKDGYIGLDTHQIQTPQAAASCLGHEAGHFISGAFYQAANPFDVRARAEFRADKAMWIYLMPPGDVQAALNAGCAEIWQLAEWFGLLDDDVRVAMNYYIANNLLELPICDGMS